MMSLFENLSTRDEALTNVDIFLLNSQKKASNKRILKQTALYFQIPQALSSKFVCVMKDVMCV